MTDNIKQLIQAHANGVTDKSGTSPLDILIAKVKNDSPPQKGPLLADLAIAVSSPEFREENMWASANLLIEKLGLQGAELYQAIGLAIEKQFPLQLRDRYEQLRSFVAAGGGLTPKMLNLETQLKSDAAPLWLDLSVEAYSMDKAGLLSAIEDLFRQHRPLVWQDIRRRIPKMIALYGTGVTPMLASIVDLLPDAKSRLALSAAIDERLGTKLSDSEKRSRQDSKVPVATKSAIESAVNKRFARIVPVQKLWSNAQLEAA